MHFEPNALYHIYNRSNETVFHTRENYLYFLSKTRKHISPYCNVLAWVLMPNHFHFLVQATDASCQNVGKETQVSFQALSKHFGAVLSSYAQAINKQQNRRGKLFSHNTKAKNLNEVALSGFNRLVHVQPDYATICFLYIHQNPVVAGLVGKLEDWEFSSFLDYAGLRDGRLVQKSLAKEILEIDFENFQRQSNTLVEEELLMKLYE